MMNSCIIYRQKVQNYRGFYGRGVSELNETLKIGRTLANKYISSNAGLVQEVFVTSNAIKLIWFLCLAPLCAFGDMLYIDINYTQAELQIFKEFAESRGEALVVLPSMEMREVYRQRSVAINKQKAKIAELEKPLKRLGCREAKGDWPHLNCPKSVRNDSNAILLWARHEAQAQIYDDLPSRYHNDDLIKGLKSLGDRVFTTVIFSGHHYEGSRQFQGDTGWLEEDEIPEVFLNLKSRLAVQNVYLLGCRTFRRDNLRFIWGEAFPNAQYMGGYVNVGYDRNDSRGHNFLRKLLNLRVQQPGSEKNIYSDQLDSAYAKFLLQPRYAWGSYFRFGHEERFIDSEPLD